MTFTVNLPILDLTYRLSAFDFRPTGVVCGDGWGEHPLQLREELSPPGDSGAPAIAGWDRPTEGRGISGLRQMRHVKCAESWMYRPRGHQTWRSGKGTTYRVMFRWKRFLRGVSIAMFDSRMVYDSAMSWDMIIPFSQTDGDLPIRMALCFSGLDVFMP